MYALLTLESTTLMWSLLAISRRWAAHGPRAKIASYAAVYLLSAALGLWTHYIFVVILAAAGGAVVWWWLGWRKAPRQDGSDLRLGLAGLPRAANQWMPLLLFLGLNALALLSYLPWLPTGIERLLNWPSQNGFAGPADGLRLTLHTLATGSIRSGPQLAWGWLLLVVLLPLLGLWQTRRSDAGVVLLLWLLLPAGVMFTFGLFNSLVPQVPLDLVTGLVPGSRGVPSLSLCSILFTPFHFLAKTRGFRKEDRSLACFPTSYHFSGHRRGRRVGRSPRSGCAPSLLLRSGRTRQLRRYRPHC